MMCIYLLQNKVIVKRLLIKHLIMKKTASRASLSKDGARNLSYINKTNSRVITWNGTHTHARTQTIGEVKETFRISLWQVTAHPGII